MKAMDRDSKWLALCFLLYMEYYHALGRQSREPLRNTSPDCRRKTASGMPSSTAVSGVGKVKAIVSSN